MHELDVKQPVDHYLEVTAGIDQILANYLCKGDIGLIPPIAILVRAPCFPALISYLLSLPLRQSLSTVCEVLIYALRRRIDVRIVDRMYKFKLPESLIDERWVKRSNELVQAMRKTRPRCKPLGSSIKLAPRIHLTRPPRR